jgi:hypothetical protein
MQIRCGGGGAASVQGRRRRSKTGGCGATRRRCAADDRDPGEGGGPCATRRGALWRRWMRAELAEAKHGTDADEVAGGGACAARRWRSAEETDAGGACRGGARRRRGRGSRRLAMVGVAWLAANPSRQTKHREEDEGKMRKGEGDTHPCWGARLLYLWGPRCRRGK